METGKVGRTVPSEPEIEGRKRRGGAVIFSGSVAELSITNHRRCRNTAPYPTDLHIIPATDPEPGREAARALLLQERARDFLTMLVTEEKQSFSSQKQALNALVFFFKEVCGQEEVDLEVRLRRTPKRIPVVINFQEILAILNRLDERCRLMAEVQYGGGLRLKELARLPVKDVDLERRQITIRQGKGDLDRVTVRPEALVEKMRGHLVAARRLHEVDREAGHPGVAIPDALGKIDLLIPPCSPCLSERPSQRFLSFSQRRQEPCA